MGTGTYRMTGQAVVLGVVAFVDLALVVAAFSRAGTAVGIGFAVVIALPTFLFLWRAVTAALVVNGGQVLVRGPLRTRSVDVEEIAGFSLGRYRILGCVCLIQLRGRSTDVPVFAIQGITGRPKRKASIRARQMVDDLNTRLAGVRSGSEAPAARQRGAGAVPKPGFNGAQR